MIFFSTTINGAKKTPSLVQEREVLQFLTRSSGFNLNMERATQNVGALY
jgi:hypothetical protein